MFYAKRRGEGDSLAKIILIGFGIILAVGTARLLMDAYDGNAVKAKIHNEFSSNAPSLENLSALGVINAVDLGESSQLKYVSSDFIPGTKRFVLEGISSTGAMDFDKISRNSDLKVSNVEYGSGFVAFDIGLGVGTERLASLGVAPQAITALTTQLTGNDTQVLNFATLDSGYSFFGSFSGTMSVSGTTLTGTGKNYFLLGLSTGGNVTYLKKLYAESLSTSSVFTVGYGNETFIAFTANGIVNYDNGTDSVGGGASSDVFIMKIRSDGSMAWRDRSEGTGTESITSPYNNINVDTDGNITLMFYYSGNGFPDFEWHGLNFSYGTFQTSGIIGFHNDGNLRFIKKFVTTGVAFPSGIINVNGGYFIEVSNSSTDLTYDGVPITKSCCFATAYNLINISDTGAYVYQKQISAPVIGSTPPALLQSENGGMIALTDMAGTGMAYSGTIGGYEVADDSKRMIVLGKISSTGSVMASAKISGDTGLDAGSGSHLISTGNAPPKVDSLGNVYVFFKATHLKFPLAKTTYGNRDWFVAKFDKNLLPIYVLNFGDANDNTDISNSGIVGIDGNGNALIQLSVSGNQTVNYESGSVTAGPLDKSVLLKISPDGSSVTGASFPFKFMKTSYDVAIANDGTVPIAGVFTGAVSYSGLSVESDTSLYNSMVLRVDMDDWSLK